MKKTLLPAILLLLLVAACCKDEPCQDRTNPDCENYDPCAVKSLPSASFFMEENIRNNEGDLIYISEDSLFSGGLIRFRSPNESAEFTHTWYVGQEVLDGFQVERNFLTVTNRPAFISISHVLEYPVDSACFQQDDGKDSVAQTLYLVEYWNELATFGTFRGVLVGQTDSFDFKVRALFVTSGEEATRANPNGLLYDKYFINFHNEGDSTDAFDFWTLNLIGSLNGGGGGSPNGTMEIDPLTNKVLINYRYRNEDYVFRGRKLNQ